ncbi:Hypothetical predicted protein [Olea europaea subsp. europaea]|uniref:Uncharacterized protein n=1 Tax=Olea europaea subsp. europaea TaxID=158383 RepID=A0A8S0S988_OLEEU|nr:Hypothetical predicted protein [Olea europaea subsp. europaea]
MLVVDLVDLAMEANFVGPMMDLKAIVEMVLVGGDGGGFSGGGGFCWTDDGFNGDGVGFDGNGGNDFVDINSGARWFLLM